MYRLIYNRIKPIIPKISQTEMIALKAGGVSIDRDIFSGVFNKEKLYIKENLKIDNDLIKQTDKVISSVNRLNKTSDYDFIYHKQVMKILGENKFLGFIIDEKYGGNKKSVINQGIVLTRIASNNPGLGINTMVPNSLGPGELLSHYGSNEMKNKYLSGLTCGEYIPCFGLTGPNNGSDATGSIDSGVLKLDKDGNKFIDVSIDKRYITLAPIANLIGVAFDLKDPNILLEEGKEGVTLALLEKGECGLIQNSYHKPLGVDFPNGTLKGSLKIPIDKVIGGEKMVGNGWKMLMECLSVGRAVSLPCSANGSNLAITSGIYHYINHRKQFKIPIGNMEGVKSKFIDMVVNSWLINANIFFTNNLLDSGLKPAVISAIMKQQATERARMVLNHGMDIYAGSGIILGKNNFIEKYYKSAPIGITVEGSNTLTRSLMIFGQGLNNAHPHIFDLFENFQNENIDDFKVNFNKMIKHVMKNYTKSLIVSNSNNEIKNLENNIIRFANLTNFVSIMGGKIKSNQMISGMMADVLSCLYLSHGLIWYNYQNDNKFNEITNLSLKTLNIEAENKMNIVIDNYPLNLKPLLKICKTRTRNIDFKDYNKLYNDLKSDKTIEHLENLIYFEKGDILWKLNRLSELDQNSKEYIELYNDIISVGEHNLHYLNN